MKSESGKPAVESLGLAGKVARAFIDSKLTPLIVIASILLGAFAVVMLPREEEPQIKVPMVDVMVAMPGFSAKEVEERATRPMEKLLWEIPGVEYVYSTSRPGESLVIAPTGAEQVVVVSPSGTGTIFTPSAREIAFTETNEIGYYAVNFITGDSSSAQYFAVNLFDPTESNIRPRENVNVGRAQVGAQTSQRVGQRELWPWFLALALIVLLIEWQAYHRKAFPWKRADA